MKVFLIKNIRNLDGTARVDGKFPERVGSEITMLNAKQGKPISYSYLKDRNGVLKEGTFTGTMIEAIHFDRITEDAEVVTADAIFEFTYLRKYKGDSEYIDNLIIEEGSKSELRETALRTGMEDVTSVDLHTLLKGYI